MLNTLTNSHDFSTHIHPPPYFTIHKTVPKPHNVEIAIWTHDFRSTSHEFQLTFDSQNKLIIKIEGDSTPCMSQKAPPSWTFTKLTPYRDNIPQFINTYKLLQIKQKQERDENFHSLPYYKETSLAKTWILQGLSCPLSLTLMLNQIIHFNSVIWEMFYQLVLLKQWVCFRL